MKDKLWKLLVVFVVAVLIGDFIIEQFFMEVVLRSDFPHLSNHCYRIFYALICEIK